MSEKTDKLISDLSKKIVFLTVLVLILLFSLAYVIYKTNAVGECGVETQQPRICGNALVEEKSIKDYNSQNTTSITYEEGEKLYKDNCMVCHSLGEYMITGPGLKGIINRVPSEEWLEGYISNCDSVYKSGDPYAAKLRSETHSSMTIFSYLNKDQIKAIIGYIKNTKATY